MLENKLVAAGLSVLLVVVLTTSVLGITSWVAFWVFAFVLFVYLKYAQR